MRAAWRSLELLSRFEAKLGQFKPLLPGPVRSMDACAKESKSRERGSKITQKWWDKSTGLMVQF
jgi:hypothetical protein